MKIRSLHAIFEGGRAGVLGAMGAAVHHALGFHTVTYDATTAVVALRGQRVDRAFEGIESMFMPGKGDDKGLIVVVTADVADSHGKPPILSVQVVEAE
jgi:flagellar biosynthesis/type III secretory pathway ATPase